MVNMNKVFKVLTMLHDNGIDSDICSPNFVVDFAFNRGIRLTSSEVVLISDMA